MPTMFAMILSAFVGYLPYAFVGADDAGAGTLILSTMVSLVTFAAIQWGLRRVRGDF